MIVIHKYDLPAAFVGATMASIADTLDDPRYRDMVWDIRDTLTPVMNAARLKAYQARKEQYDAKR